MEQGKGKVIGDWVLDQNIGAGSFAVVWKARHAMTGQVVAIKEISTDKLNKKLKLSLESEVSILKQITHKNIVQLLEVIEVRLIKWHSATPSVEKRALYFKCATTGTLPRGSLKGRWCLLRYYSMVLQDDALMVWAQCAVAPTVQPIGDILALKSPHRQCLCGHVC